MRDMRNAYKILGGWEGIIRRILGKYGGKLWTGFIWLRIGTIGRLW